jgi:hypothetical protein
MVPFQFEDIPLNSTPLRKLVLLNVIVMFCQVFIFENSEPFTYIENKTDLPLLLLMSSVRTLLWLLLLVSSWNVILNTPGGSVI